MRRSSAVSTHQLGFQAVDAVDAQHAGDRPLGPPHTDGLGLALHQVLAGVAVGDGGGGGGSGGLVDVDRAGFGQALDAGRRVDTITDDDALLHAVHGDGLPGDDSDQGRQSRELVGLAEGVDGVDEASRPARTARSASFSRAIGTPHTAMTASPMNFSMVPPWRPMMARASSK